MPTRTMLSVTRELNAAAMQFNMVQVMAWIVMFMVLILVLEHGLFARLEGRAFAWRGAIAY
jgi:ABC-type nitrate/sulfonate/bicarbonate transport system permease component